MLQFATHHAGTGAHRYLRRQPCTQLCERQIGLCGQGLAQGLRMRLQRARRTTAVRLGFDTARLTPLPRPHLNGAETDVIFRCNLRLGQVTLLERGNDPFA